MATTKTVAIKEMSIETATIRIVGMTPLITHQFPEKARKAIRDKKGGVKTRTREKCDPEAECQAAAYVLSDGGYGFPVTGIKKAILNAAHKDLGVAKTLISKGLFIHGDEGLLVRIDCEGGPKMREDVVRVASGGADLRYRPEFETWGATLRIEYDSDLLTLETIVNMIERAGFGVGIGEWRPQKDGEYGRFRVERTEVPE